MEYLKSLNHVEENSYVVKHNKQLSKFVGDYHQYLKEMDSMCTKDGTYEEMDIADGYTCEKVYTEVGAITHETYESVFKKSEKYSGMFMSHRGPVYREAEYTQFKFKKQLEDFRYEDRDTMTFSILDMHPDHCISARTFSVKKYEYNNSEKSNNEASENLEPFNEIKNYFNIIKSQCLCEQLSLFPEEDFTQE